MATTNQNLQLIRQRLGYPDVQVPTDLQLLDIMVEHIADHCAQLQNTRNHWSVGNWVLNTSAGVEDYLVSAADFGRPFLVYTTDDDDTYHSRREVPFSFLNDADQRYSGPQQSYSASPWSAAVMCFYRTSPSTPSWYVRPVPIPGAAGTYQVWYEADYNTVSLGDAPGLSSFHHLIRVQTALSALPLCAWGTLSIRSDRAGWAMQAEALRAVLLHDEEIYQKRFDAYKANSTRDGVNNKLGYCPDYDYGGDGAGALVTGYGF